ncbi:hypothetical protein [Aquibacillus kalidii]|uniref:hypothetical protein n=1 Tax=Aquibacillus kalidii TaxID=2762597 RepID=UPI001645F0D5|nr:hypothetical protein [Aquibacillus kalidii]
MKYFSDECSDIDGHSEQLKQMKSRFSDETNTFLATNSFHDAHIMDINIKNLFNPDVGGEEDDPTLIEAHLLHWNGDKYVVKWHGVNKYLMDYDIHRNTYEDSDKIAFDGQRGLDDWITDEITAYDEVYLTHKIILASDTKIEIRFKKIDIKKIGVKPS